MVEADGQGGAPGELVKNGLPRVAWEGAAKRKKYRVVLVNEQSYRGRPVVHAGAVAILEAAVEANGMGMEQWERVRYEEDEELKDGALQALIQHAMLFDGPHCMACADCGALKRDGLPPQPCTQCERGQQVAEARR